MKLEGQTLLALEEHITNTDAKGSIILFSVAHVRMMVAMRPRYVNAMRKAKTQNRKLAGSFHERPEAHLISFGNNANLGSIWIRPWRSSPTQPWRELGIASGNVTIPANKEVRWDFGTRVLNTETPPPPARDLLKTVCVISVYAILPYSADFSVTELSRKLTD